MDRIAICDMPRLADTRFRDRLQAVDIGTGPYPVFATDLQAQFMARMKLAEGESVVRETVFENRFMHAPERVRLGADIAPAGGEARVRGVDRLQGAPVMAPDLPADDDDLDEPED